MADQKPPSGPDLRAGVDSTALPDGERLLGQVDGEAVLLARAGGRCYAVGATCTHYGGPLAEGIITGGTIRCPWHHTAFRLDTGEVERPPALDPIACWAVEESDGRIRVLERRTPPPRDATRLAATPQSVAIVGIGAAGVVAAKTLRDHGYRGALTMIDADSDAPVDRPNLSKDYLAGNAPEEWVTMRGPEFFQEREIEIVRSRATRLDTSARRIALDDGRSLAFDALLLATGASPIRLPLPSDDSIPLLTLRSLGDSRAIIDAAKRAGAGGTAVVIGASFIGLEVAAALRTRGLAVHVVAPETRPLERVLGPDVGDWIRRLHEQHGVVFHLGNKPASIQGKGVVLESGDRLDASFLVAGVGVRPNVELAEQAGVTIDRGVVVNEYLETSVRGIFAAGDVARYPDSRSGMPIRVEHWVAAERQAQTAARNILGAAERFTAVPFFWSAHYDAVIDYVGHAERWDSIEIDGDLDARDCTVRYVADGRTLAAASVGRDRENLELEVVMEHETSTTAGATR